MAKEKKLQPSQPTSIAKVAGSGTQATTTCEEASAPTPPTLLPPLKVSGEYSTNY